MHISKEVESIMDNNELFIEKYKELEYEITKRYKLSKMVSPIPFIEKRNEYLEFSKELNYCREVRNFLQHESKIDKGFAVIASDEMIQKMDEIINAVKNPIRIKDVYISIDKVYYKGLDSYVYPSMVSMDYKKYSHIPIIEKRKLVGVFSKTSIFKYLLEEENSNFSENIQFKDIKRYISLDEEYYLFTKKDTPVEDIIEEVIMNFKNGKRVAIIFVTDNGMKDGNLVGLLTPYDILGL